MITFSQVFLHWLTFLKVAPFTAKLLIELSSSSRGSIFRSNLDGMERLAGVDGAAGIIAGAGGGALTGAIDCFFGLDSALAAKIKLLLAGIVNGRAAGVGRLSSTVSAAERWPRDSSLALKKKQ